MSYTPEQAAIVSHRVEPGKMLKVRAYAGTGKTHTLVGCANANPTSSMIYLAFNKSVELEAKTKFPRNVLSKTVHALAWASKGRNYPSFGTVRYYNVMKHHKLGVYPATLVLMTLDNWLNSADEDFMLKHAAPDIKKKFGTTDMREALTQTAKAIWQDMLVGAEPFPMSHSGYLKLYQLSKPRLSQSVVLLDEAQDTNPVTFDIVKNQLRYGARIMMAGDPYQQIYSWRGAVDAMSTQNCDELCLTQSFRFGKNVANVANALLKSFFNEQIPLVGHDVPDELVRSFPQNEKYTVICRTNAELFNQAVRLTFNKTLMHVIGDTSFTQFLASIMDVYFLYSGKRAEIRDRSMSFFRDYEHFCEFVEMRMDMDLLAKIAIVEKYKSAIPSYIQNIKTLITSEPFALVILVTAHKSKGLEWNNVMLADDFEDLFDQKTGQLSRIRQQIEADKRYDLATKDKLMESAIDKDEINLVYVAATRAKRRLIMNNDLSRLVAGSFVKALRDERPEQRHNDNPVRAAVHTGRIREMFDDPSVPKDEDTGFYEE